MRTALHCTAFSQKRQEDARGRARVGPRVVAGDESSARSARCNRSPSRERVKEMVRADDVSGRDEVFRLFGSKDRLRGTGVGPGPKRARMDVREDEREFETEMGEHWPV